METFINILQGALDILGKIIALPLIIPGFILVWIGNGILRLTKKEY